MAFKHPNKGHLVQHHLTPLSRGGSKKDQANIVFLWYSRHKSLHRIFGNLTLEEIINVMGIAQRFILRNRNKIENIKRKLLETQGKEWRQWRHNISTKLNKELGRPVSRVVLIMITEPQRWHNLFNGNDIEASIKIFERLLRYKNNGNGQIKNNKD